MSHFYGTLQGSRGEATRCGTKSSGIVTYAASWQGAIRVCVTQDKFGHDVFTVEMMPWKGAGDYRMIAHGEMGKGESLTLGESK